MAWTTNADGIWVNLPDEAVGNPTRADRENYVRDNLIFIRDTRAPNLRGVCDSSPGEKICGNSSGEDFFVCGYCAPSTNKTIISISEMSTVGFSENPFNLYYKQCFISAFAYEAGSLAAAQAMMPGGATDSNLNSSSIAIGSWYTGAGLDIANAADPLDWAFTVGATEINFFVGSASLDPSVSADGCSSGDLIVYVNSMDYAVYVLEFRFKPKWITVA